MCWYRERDRLSSLITTLPICLSVFSPPAFPGRHLAPSTRLRTRTRLSIGTRSLLVVHVHLHNSPPPRIHLLSTRSVCRCGRLPLRLHFLSTPANTSASTCRLASLWFPGGGFCDRSLCSYLLHNVFFFFFFLSLFFFPPQGVIRRRALMPKWIASDNYLYT